MTVDDFAIPDFTPRDGQARVSVAITTPKSKRTIQGLHVCHTCLTLVGATWSDSGEALIYVSASPWAGPCDLCRLLMSLQTEIHATALMLNHLIDASTSVRAFLQSSEGEKGMDAADLDAFAAAGNHWEELLDALLSVRYRVAAAVATTEASQTPPGAWVRDAGPEPGVRKD